MKHLLQLDFRKALMIVFFFALYRSFITGSLMTMAAAGLMGIALLVEFGRSRT